VSLGSGAPIAPAAAACRPLVLTLSQPPDPMLPALGVIYYYDGEPDGRTQELIARSGR
jgi:hypothetical protein